MATFNNLNPLDLTTKKKSQISQPDMTGSSWAISAQKNPVEMGSLWDFSSTSNPTSGPVRQQPVEQSVSTVYNAGTTATGVKQPVGSTSMNKTFDIPGGQFVGTDAEYAQYLASRPQTGATQPVQPVNPQPEATARDIYGNIPTENTEYNQAVSDYKNLLQDEGLTEEQIRQKTMERFQAQIDALNRYYTEVIAKENVAGEGRLGSTAAVQARRGLIGSDFGAAQTEKTRQYNTDVVRAIQAEQNAKIQDILSEGQTRVAEEASAKLAAKKEGAKAYIEFLAGEADRKTARVGSTVANLLANQVEPTDDEYKKLASTLGVSVAELKSQYNTAKSSATTNVEPKVVGNALVNPVTGEVIYSEPTSALDVQQKQLQIEKLKQEINNSTSEIDKQLKQTQLAKLQQEVSDATSTATQEPYKAQLATQGRQSVSELLSIAQANPGIFGRTAALPLPDSARTDAFRNYKAQLDYLKGNIIPAALAAMRDASKTGGALGQVSDKEGAWLASSLGALSMEQEPAQVIKQLQQIDASLSRWQTAVQQNTAGGEYDW